MMRRPPVHAYLSPGPLSPGMHGLADAPATDSPGWWQTQWNNAVQKFQDIWTAYTNSKVTLATSGYALDTIDPTEVDAGKLADLQARGAALANEESSIDDIVSQGLAEIQAVESKLGWPQTQLGIFGIDDAIVITGVVTAGVAAVGYYVYKITTHTEDVNQLATELQALGKGVLTPQQLIQLQTAQQASTPTSGVIGEILSSVLPYVGIALGGWLIWKLIAGKRS
jgi:hypothetical protein